MLDIFNPALREAKRRAKEEYQQRMLQGKIDATMRHAHEKADSRLQAAERRRQQFPVMVKKVLIFLGGLLIAAMMLSGK